MRNLPANNEITAGFFQFAPFRGNVAANLRKVEMELLAMKYPPELLVLPELFTTGYLFESREKLLELAETIPGPSTQALAVLSGKTGSVIVAGLAEKCGEKLFNSSVVVGKEGVLSIYRKIHLFDREKELFDRGDKLPSPVRIGKISLGVIICFDWAFPEITRLLALKGINILCQPANLVLDYCQRVMVARAIENRIFTITANRTGREEINGYSLSFTGRSQIVDPDGRVLVSAGKEETGIRCSSLKLDKALNKMLTARNHIFDERRTDLYCLGGEEVVVPDKKNRS